MSRRLINKLLFPFRQRRIERELREEMDLHRAMLEADIAHQDPTTDKALDARRRFGNVTRAREDAREAWFFVSLEETLRSVRAGVRSCLRAPLVFVASIVTLALGLGANTAMFGFLDTVLFSSLPVSNPHELVLIGSRSVSYGLFEQLTRSTQDVFAGVAGRALAPVALVADGVNESLAAEIVTGSYFDTLRVRPIVGRLFDAADDETEGGHPVVVIGYRLWQARFSGDPGIVGRPVSLNGHRFVIVGVTPRGFNGAHVGWADDVIQVPSAMQAALTGRPRVPRPPAASSFLQLIARLAPGVSRQQADTALQALRLRPGLDLTLSPAPQGFQTLRSRFERPALIAQALGACVLLTVFASVAGLIATRTSARRHELAVRISLGASRRRVIAQLVIESAIVAVAGGVIGVALAALLTRILASILRIDLPIWPSSVGVVVASGLVVVSAIAIGLVPAVLETRRAKLGGLRESFRGGSHVGWFASFLVMVQVAVCLVLIFGAGLFARTLHNLRSIETGLDLRNIVLLSIDTRLAGYPPDRSAEFQGRWLRRVRMVPGVTSAALASIVAMSGASEGSDLVVPGSSRGKGGLVNNFFNAVTPDYFRTVGIPLVAGRLFTDTDDANAGRVVIVNQQFVDYYWPGESALGRVIAPRGQQATIIGIVETAKYRGLREDPAIVIYRPLAQHPAARVTLHAKVSGNTAATAQAIARAGREIEPAIPTLEIDTFFSVVDAQIANERVLNVLASLFAALALVITGVGLYGLVAYSVTRRTREIGVRMAIGARLGHLVRLFVARVAALVVAGALVGVPLALAAGRQIHSLLYGLEPTSVSTLVPATLMLIIVAVTAAGIPAFRAARVNPVIALRDS